MQDEVNRRLSNTFELVPAQPDAETAASLKKDIAEKLADLCNVMNRANAAGFEVQFNLAKQWNGNQIAALVIAKHF
jgi:hypothetical protein